ncbi:Double-stranded RNA-specific editase B2 [Blomia tropicalis]|nr:Double-stranded RNA-specific editase B2 [Blomia tropicalis]
MPESTKLEDRIYEAVRDKWIEQRTKMLDNKTNKNMLVDYYVRLREEIKKGKNCPRKILERLAKQNLISLNVKSMVTSPGEMRAYITIGTGLNEKVFTSEKESNTMAESFTEVSNLAMEYIKELSRKDESTVSPDLKEMLTLYRAKSYFNFNQLKQRFPKCIKQSQAVQNPTFEYVLQVRLLNGDTFNRTSSEFSGKCTHPLRECFKSIGEDLIHKYGQDSKYVFDDNQIHQVQSIAAFVVTDVENNDQIEVVSIGTGSGFVQDQQSINDSNGETILDSHSEIIACRALKLALFEQIQSGSASKYLDLVDNAFRFKSNLRLHLFVSEPPKGAARFTPDSEEKINAVRYLDAFDNEDQFGQIASENRKYGQFGTASDKIARWTVCGVQGSILSSLVEPIYLTSIIVNSSSESNNFTDAFYGRINEELINEQLKGGYRCSKPTISIHVKPRSEIFQELNGDTYSETTKSSISHNWYIGFDPTSSKFIDRDIEWHFISTGRKLNKPEDSTISRVSKCKFLENFRFIIQHFDYELLSSKQLKDCKYICDKDNKDRETLMKMSYRKLKYEQMIPHLTMFALY